LMTKVSPYCGGGGGGRREAMSNREVTRAGLVMWCNTRELVERERKREREREKERKSHLEY